MLFKYNYKVMNSLKITFQSAFQSKPFFFLFFTLAYFSSATYVEILQITLKSHFKMT